MDTAADPAAGHSLVNDLDLLVYELETGMEWRGNGAIGFDHSNNGKFKLFWFLFELYWIEWFFVVERVSFSPPRPGNYTILVNKIEI